MRRKKRHMEEGAGPTASAIDTFAGALGAAIAMLLMLMTMQRNPYENRGKGTRLPSMFILAWSAGMSDEGGLGPGRFQLRIRKSGEPDGYTKLNGIPTPGEEYKTWDIHEIRGQRWNEVKNLNEDQRLASVIWTAGQLLSNTEWVIEAKLLSDPPIQPPKDKGKKQAGTKNPTANDPGGFDDYIELVKRINLQWEEFNQGKCEAQELRAAIQKVTAEYMDFYTTLAEFNTACGDAETASGRNAAAIASARIQAAKKALIKARGWTYGKRGQVAAYVDSPAGDAVGFESMLTNLVLNEFSAPNQPPVQMLDGSAMARPAEWLNPKQIRYRYLRETQKTCAKNFKITINLSFTAPGTKEIVNQKHELSDLLGAEKEKGWLKIADLRVDALGMVRMDPETKRSQPATPEPEPLPIHNTRPTAWDNATFAFNELCKSANLDNNVLWVVPRVDKEFSHLNEETEFVDRQFPGPGTTGLVLMAFNARGHLVGQQGSTYKEDVEKIVQYVCKGATLNASTYGTTDHYAIYQVGFTVLALADVYPGAEANASSEAKPIREALIRAVNVSIARQGDSGGWGYNGDTTDTSVAAVHVKGLVEARSVLKSIFGDYPELFQANPNLIDRIDTSLGRAATFFKNAHPNGELFYRYRIGTRTNDAIHRQPGSLLAEHLSIHSTSSPTPKLQKGSFETPLIDNIEKWLSEPSVEQFIQTRHPYKHYAVFYGTLLMTLHWEPKSRVDWFHEVQRKMLPFGLGFTSSDDTTIYGAAMTIYQLMTPFHVALREQLQIREQLRPIP